MSTQKSLSQLLETGRRAQETLEVRGTFLSILQLLLLFPSLAQWFGYGGHLQAFSVVCGDLAQ